MPEALKKLVIRLYFSTLSFLYFEYLPYHSAATLGLSGYVKCK